MISWITQIYDVLIFSNTFFREVLACFWFFSPLSWNEVKTGHHRHCFVEVGGHHQVALFVPLPEQSPAFCLRNRIQESHCHCSTERLLLQKKMPSALWAHFETQSPLLFYLSTVPSWLSCFSYPSSDWVGPVTKFAQAADVGLCRFPPIEVAH